MTEHPRRLAVLGSPIDHSKSPQLHRAAYAVLGLDWEYGRAEVASGGLEDFLAGLDASWRGLSLTMPLKREVLPLLDERDEVIDLVGAANTLVFSDGARRGFNTDVYGARMALLDTGVMGADRESDHALVLGAGATAASTVAALAALGIGSVTVATRSPERCADLRSVAEGVGIRASFVDYSATIAEALVVVSTVPGTTSLVREFPASLRASAPLLDIAYDPWPTPLAEHWLAAGGAVFSGLGMLVHQAHAQVRAFVSGRPDRPLDRDAEVLSAMLAAVPPAGGARPA